MKLSQILPNIKKSERSSFIGCSGSGKTTLAELVCSTYEYLVVLDTKHDLNWKGYRVFTNLDKLIRAADKEVKERGSKNRFMYRPERGFERDTDYVLQTKLYEWLWDRKHRGLYVDEAAQITTSTQICPSLKDLLQRGRSRGIPVLSGSQRPSGVKQELLTESENVYCFLLRQPADKKKVLEFGNIDVERIAQKGDKDNHWFIYSHNGAVTEPLILTL